MRDWLIIKRKDKDMTQMALATQAGISRAYYAQLESNRRDPSIKVAIRLARILDLEWTCFFENSPAD
jgi:putative transcriptional regulator